MVRDDEETAVHTMSPVHRMGPAFYASLPRDIEIPGGHGPSGEGARQRLVSILWEHLVATDSLLWQCRLSSNGDALPIRVVHDPLGKPHLLLGECLGPAVSFSECGRTVWAALSADGSDIGIDVAHAGEFRGDYPFHRVFNAQEFQHVVRMAGGDVARASALLWSAKEAAVKSLGCAFHLVEPRDVSVRPAAAEDGEYAFEACLSGRGLARLPMCAGRSVWVRSLPQGQMWLSIGFLDRQPSERDRRRLHNLHAPWKRNEDSWQETLNK